VAGLLLGAGALRVAEREGAGVLRQRRQRFRGLLCEKRDKRAGSGAVVMEARRMAIAISVAKIRPYNDGMALRPY